VIVVFVGSVNSSTNEAAAPGARSDYESRYGLPSGGAVIVTPDA